MAHSGKSLSQRLGDASSLARSVASGIGLSGRIKNVQSLLCEMRAERLGVIRILDSVGVRVVTPWNRDREALVSRAPRSFEAAMGVPDGGPDGSTLERHHALHATISGPGGFAVMFLLRGAQLNAQPDGARLCHGNCEPIPRTTRSRATIKRGGYCHEAF